MRSRQADMYNAACSDLNGAAKQPQRWLPPTTWINQCTVTDKDPTSLPIFTCLFIVLHAHHLYTYPHIHACCYMTMCLPAMLPPCPRPSGSCTNNTSSRLACTKRQRMRNPGFLICDPPAPAPPQPLIHIHHLHRTPRMGKMRIIPQTHMRTSSSGSYTSTTSTHLDTNCLQIVYHTCARPPAAHGHHLHKPMTNDCLTRPRIT